MTTHGSRKTHCHGGCVSGQELRRQAELAGARGGRVWSGWRAVKTEERAYPAPGREAGEAGRQENQELFCSLVSLWRLVTRASPALVSKITCCSHLKGLNKNTGPLDAPFLAQTQIYRTEVPVWEEFGEWEQSRAVKEG